jgi:hypothetical protein
MKSLSLRHFFPACLALDGLPKSNTEAWHTHGTAFRNKLWRVKCAGKGSEVAQRKDLFNTAFRLALFAIEVPSNCGMVINDGLYALLDTTRHSSFRSNIRASASWLVTVM